LLQTPQLVIPGFVPGIRVDGRNTPGFSSDEPSLAWPGGGHDA